MCIKGLVLSFVSWSGDSVDLLSRTICTTLMTWLVYHKPRSWLVGFDPKHCCHCWYCKRKKLIPQRSAGVETPCLKPHFFYGGCNLQVAGCRLQVSIWSTRERSTLNWFCEKKKAAFTASCKPEISVVPGNCFLGVTFCSRSPIDQNFSALHF